MTQNANEVTNSRSFPYQSVFASSIHSSMSKPMTMTELLVGVMEVRYKRESVEKIPPARFLTNRL
jgi:hypothetical protein